MSDFVGKHASLHGAQVQWGYRLLLLNISSDERQLWQDVDVVVCDRGTGEVLWHWQETMQRCMTALVSPWYKAVIGRTKSTSSANWNISGGPNYWALFLDRRRRRSLLVLDLWSKRLVLFCEQARRKVHVTERRVILDGFSSLFWWLTGVGLGSFSRSPPTCNVIFAVRGRFFSVHGFVVLDIRVYSIVLFYLLCFGKFTQPADRNCFEIWSLTNSTVLDVAVARNWGLSGIS